MPNKGRRVYVEGFGSPTFVGATNLDDLEKAKIGLKYEGIGLDEGYGRGTIWIDYKEFDENRVYPEQISKGESIVESNEKAIEILKERL